MAHVPQDLLDRIAALERQVRQLAGRAQIRPAMNQVLNGNVIIGEGGQFLVREPDGTTLLQVGELVEGEFGFVLRRRDGTAAISTFNGDSLDAPQVLRLMDSLGHSILSEDITAGGLYKPWIPYPIPVAYDANTWPGTDSTAWTTVSTSVALFQHPRLRYFLSSLNGAIGQSRILVGGQVIATSAAGTPAMAGTAAVPGYEYDMSAEIEIQLRVVSSSGTVRIQPRYLYGVGSAN